MNSPNPTQPYDIRIQDAVQRRFGMQVVEFRADEASAVVSMPMAGMTNPLTGAPTTAPLGFLVDTAGSVANFARRGRGFPVTITMTIDIYPGGHTVLGQSSVDVIAAAHVKCSNETQSVASCELSSAGTVVGVGTVRSIFVQADDVAHDYPTDTMTVTGQSTLRELMAVTVVDGGGLLQQQPDPMLLNAMANIHGGVAATGMELAASAVIFSATDSHAYRTGSVHINFLRPFAAGPDARYTSDMNYRGSTVCVADARAIGADGKVAGTTRLTAYRTT